MKMKKILLIDDEEDFCYFVKKNLEATGNFEVEVYNDDIDIAQEARRLQPNLILLDIKMPRRDGSDIALELKRHRETKDIPFVFLTALVNEEETQKRGNFIGGEYFLAKPVRIKELIDTVNRFAI
jgi:DNA-binding response OmpR family regulator